MLTLRLKNGSLISIAFVIAFVVMPPSARGADATFKVDQRAYVERANSKLRRLLKPRKFIVQPHYNRERAKRVMDLYTRLRSYDVEIIPPFERSDRDPDLPAYLAVRAECPRFDFEFGRVKTMAKDTVGILGRATQNFALYRLPPDIDPTGKTMIFAFRGERMIGQLPEWERRRIRAGKDEILLTMGGFTFFDAKGCHVKYSAPVHRLRDESAKESFNEIVRIGDEYWVVSVYPLSRNSLAYSINLNLIDLSGHMTNREIHRLSSTSEKGRNAQPPVKGER